MIFYTNILYNALTPSHLHYVRVTIFPVMESAAHYHSSFLKQVVFILMDYNGSRKKLLVDESKCLIPDFACFFQFVVTQEAP